MTTPPARRRWGAGGVPLMHRSRRLGVPLVRRTNAAGARRSDAPGKRGSEHIPERAAKIYRNEQTPLNTHNEGRCRGTPNNARIPMSTEDDCVSLSRAKRG